MMSQDILFDGQLDHLSCFANRALLNLFGTTDFQVLRATISSSWDCPYLRTNPIGLISIRCATFTVAFNVLISLPTLSRIDDLRGWSIAVAEVFT